MPKITEVHLIEVTPEKFLENCSPAELREVDHLIQSPRFQVRMVKPEKPAHPVIYPEVDDIACKLPD